MSAAPDAGGPEPSGTGGRAPTAAGHGETNGGRGATGGVGVAGSRAQSGAGGSGAAGRSPVVTQTGGAGSAAVGGGAGASASGSDVIGKLVDSYHNPVAGALIRVGSLSTQTNASGQFSIPDVPSVYDLEVALTRTPAGSVPVHEVWRYEGLTRRDPLVQCVSGFALHTSSVSLHVQVDGFGQANGPGVVASFGSPEVASEGWTIATTDFTPPAVNWYGSNTDTQGYVHALLFDQDDRGQPTGFLSHQAVATTLGATPASVTLDLPMTTIASATLSGNVAGTGTLERRDVVLTLFDDGTQLTTYDEHSAGTTFSYTVPSLPSSTSLLVALEVSDASATTTAPPYAAAVVDAATANGPLNLEIPRVPTLTMPSGGATGIDENTVFGWSGLGRASVLIASDSTYQNQIYVVTAASQAHLPLGADAIYKPAANTPCFWYLFARDATTVDDVASEAGLLLRGHWTPGHYLASASQTFTTSP